MNDQPTANTFEEGESYEGATAHFSEALQGFMGKMSPSSVFSDPQAVGDDLVFTAAAFERVGGFGFGTGQGHDASGATGGGGGGGAGGMSNGRPVAVIRIGPSGIEVKPVLDLTRIGVTVVLAAIGVRRALRRR
jgi:uncharacterized spore protein YtfJ